MKVRLGWKCHFFEIVLPAWQAYLNAERILSETIAAKKPAERARFDALREGGAAAFYVHHYADIVAAERAPFLPDEIRGVGQVRGWLAAHCKMLRTEQLTNDVALLGDVADALKHAHLTRRLEERDVAARDAVIVIGSGYGELGFSEGKYGGVDQVLILAQSGSRALSSILQNVIDAWYVGIGWDLPELGTT